MNLKRIWKRLAMGVGTGALALSLSFGVLASNGSVAYADHGHQGDVDDLLGNDFDSLFSQLFGRSSITNFGHLFDSLVFDGGHRINTPPGHLFPLATG